MARTAHTLKRPAKGSKSSKNKKPRKTPRLESLVIEVRCNQIRCSILSIGRRYCDNAIEVLKVKLSEKLLADKVEVIGHLRIATPRHHSELLNFFASLSLQIEGLEIETTVNSLESDDWVDKALSVENLNLITLYLCDMKSERRDLIKSIIDRSVAINKARIDLTDQDGFNDLPGTYVDGNLVSDEYLLEIAKTAKQNIELGFTASLTTVEGILATAKALDERSDAAKVVFQIKEDARAFKAEIIDRWGLKEVIEREFKDENQPGTTPLIFEQFTLYNEGCMNICIFDGRILLKLPTEFLLDGRMNCMRVLPYRFTIERVIDNESQLALNGGFFEVRHN